MKTALSFHFRAEKLIYYIMRLIKYTDPSIIISFFNRKVILKTLSAPLGSNKLEP